MELNQNVSCKKKQCCYHYFMEIYFKKENRILVLHMFPYVYFYIDVCDHYYVFTNTFLYIHTFYIYIYIVQTNDIKEIYVIINLVIILNAFCWRHNSISQPFKAKFV